jgi:hypothetical protein
MKFLEISDTLLSDDVKVIENELKVTFPQDFVEHYLEFNGGYPEKDKFLWDKNDHNITTTVNTFFSLKFEGFGNIEFIYQDLVLNKKYLPNGIIPFASDDGGNLFCISCRDEDYNCVYYCNNDHYNTNNNEAHLTLLNKSFNDFLNNLI